jgi:hypothetical protein
VAVTLPNGREVLGWLPGVAEHRLEHAAVGVLGLDLVPPWHLNPIMPYTLWREVLDQLPGVTFRHVGSFEPSAVVGGRAANIGGTVIIGEDGPIELNPLTAQLLRA